MRKRIVAGAATQLKPLSSGMNWAKLAISGITIVTAVVVAQQWRKGAAAVVLPVTLIALYDVWRWRLDE